eukprot:8651755-Lingulodinium_polyedra.AAC.1
MRRSTVSSSWSSGTSGGRFTARPPTGSASRCRRPSSTRCSAAREPSRSVSVRLPWCRPPLFGSPGCLSA